MMIEFDALVKIANDLFEEEAVTYPREEWGYGPPLFQNVVLEICPTTL